jgi:hypothetical protein
LLEKRVAENRGVEQTRCHPERSEGSCRERADPRLGLPGRLRRSLAALGMTAVALCSLLGTPVRAQVGHDPASTPYRDIYKGHTFTGIGGYIGGSGAEFGIGPHEGPLYGIRYDIRTASAVQMGIQLAQADLQRLIVDPFVELANRVSGPVDQRVSFVEVDLQLNLTGGKTWRRLAPFVGAGLGFTFAGETDADTSGYEFGNKLYFAPHAGFRFFITSRLHLRGDARIAFWKMSYPDSFTREPPLEPGNSTDGSNAVITDGNTSEWTTTPWLQAGLGYSFSP